MVPQIPGVCALLCTFLVLLPSWPGVNQANGETSKETNLVETSEFSSSKNQPMLNSEELRRKYKKKNTKIKKREKLNKRRQTKMKEGKSPSLCLSSPGYPSNYPSKSHKTQNFSLPSGGPIEITFQQFDVEPSSSGCSYDYVEVFDGNGKSVDGKLCGKSLPKKLKIETSSASVLFHSDDSVTKKGFKFCYTQGFPRCLTSPGYPNNYPNKSKTRKEFSVPAGLTMDITFQDFDVESDSTCRWDWLKFFDGKNNLVGKQLCGNSLPPNFSIPTSTASFAFDSDSSVTKKGFKFCYKPGQETGTCVTSPGYPNNYPDKSDTTQELSVPNGNKIKIIFRDFQVEPSSSGCSYDYVEFLDGKGKTVGSKLCGDSLPKELMIETSNASVLFHSDDSVAKKGFKFCYTPEPVASNCGIENSPRHRISGGSETAPNQFPWMVRLPMGCGGSLITARHVLTAKHCVEARGTNWRGRNVKFSVHNQNDPNDYDTVPIKDYVTPNIENHDIAIVILERPVDLADNTIGTVCLPESSEKDYRGLKALAMGWGWTPDTSSQSTRLQKLWLTVADYDVHNWLWTKVVFKDGVPLDVCRGDSGGPLVYKEDGRWTIIGTVQGGSYCNDHNGKEGMWAKVTDHLEWIKSIIANH